MWCVTSGCSGLICIDVTHMSLVNPLGTVIHAHSMTLFFGCAGTSVTGPCTMTSGWICQPSGHLTGGGASLASPSGAPLSAHFAMVSIALCVRERSFKKCPTRGSANHGGIFLLATAAFIAFAQGRAL